MKKLMKIKLKISLKHVAAFIAFVVLVILNIVLIVQNIRMSKEMVSLSEKYDAQLLDHNKSVEVEFLKLYEQISVLSENQNTDMSSVKRNLSNMNKTYGSILEEEKKQRIDVSSKDNEINKLRDEAFQNYVKGNFKLSYEGYTKVLSFVENDLDARLHKMKSLFKLNKTDKTSYQEILKDLDILKMNGSLDEESIEIEKIIKVEMDGLDG